MNKEANMISRGLTGLLGAMALAASLQAQAATIALQPSQVLVQQLASFSIDVLISATDAPGLHPGRNTGEVIIDFDPALISYTSGSLSLPSGEILFPALSIGSSAGRQTLAFGFRNAADTGSVATLTFTAIGNPGSIATLGIADNNKTTGSFVNAESTMGRYYPAFTGTSVQIVPLPGAAWLMIPAFGALASRVRRSSQAGRRAR